MVATPIDNLADISLRALHVLQIVDTVACEDTRHTQGLLRSYGLERPGSQLLALHQHNEAEAAQQVIARLQQGQRIAYVSDAGTPGVSDPGARLAVLQASREPLYREVADLVFDTSSLSPEAAADALAARLATREDLPA